MITVEPATSTLRPAVVTASATAASVSDPASIALRRRREARAFDHSFRPASSSRRRWERLWVAARRGATLPPISVFRLGEAHFVDDGHHRVSVAHALGMTAIDAEVTDLGRGPARLREA
jgi:hypothetical protein